jgi:hypothetical protein
MTECSRVGGSLRRRQHALADKASAFLADNLEDLTNDLDLLLFGIGNRRRVGSRTSFGAES